MNLHHEVVAPNWREFVVEKADDGSGKVNDSNYEYASTSASEEKLR